MQIKIRKFEEKDKESIENLFVELQSQEKSVYADRVDGETIKEKYVSRLVKEHTTDQGTLLVAEIEGEVVGYIAAHTEKEMINITKTLWIEDIVVSSMYRGNGIGAQLMQAVENFAKEKGIAKLELCVLENNVSAYNLYKKFGFKDRSIEMVKDI